MNETFIGQNGVDTRTLTIDILSLAKIRQQVNVIVITLFLFPSKKSDIVKDETGRGNGGRDEGDVRGLVND